ncbi:MAG TPA: hypothetical protein VJW93_15125 [Candidatus Acidoferrales bacterium]|nr:hypothetical protein [Candidatus Acidoferrales bacterium]
MEYDVVVRNGVVVDGSGAPRYRADVAIKDRKIAALIDADAASASAKRAIDATGMAIAPGFIDMRSNSDWVLPIADHAQIPKAISASRSDHVRRHNPKNCAKFSPRRDLLVRRRHLAASIFRPRIAEYDETTRGQRIAEVHVLLRGRHAGS